MNTASAFPNELRFIPIHGVKSFRVAGAGGAWRLFVLAKNLAGIFDHIERESVRSFAYSLGVHPKTFEHWLNAARDLGFVKDVQRQAGEWVLVLVSHTNAAKILGHEERRNKFVSLPARLLVGKNWRSYVFASFEATFNGRLISRKKQFEISGVPEVTQRQYDKQAGVERKKNYAVSNIHANGFSAVLDFGKRANLFKYWDKKTHQLKLGWRLPDSRIFPVLAGGFSQSRKTMSLFNYTETQFKNTVKKLSKADSPIREVYLFSHVSTNGNSMWIHMPLR